MFIDPKLTPWWKVYLGGSLYHFTIEGENFEFEVDQQSNNWSLNTTQQKKKSLDSTFGKSEF